MKRLEFILYIHSSYTALCNFSSDFTQSVGLIGRVIGPSQGLYLNTEHKHRITRAHAHTRTHTHTPNINALSGIRTHDYGLRASEESPCLDRSGTVTG
jgi:hypothetical protein